MVVAGRFHKDGWRFGRPFDVIDQCMQLIGDMMNIKRLSSDAAVSIENGDCTL